VPWTRAGSTMEKKRVVSVKEGNKELDSIGPFYAHSKEGEPPENWQRLGDHLKNVAEMARGFAQMFGTGDWDIGEIVAEMGDT
jgi:hypothetical protein